MRTALVSIALACFGCADVEVGSLLWVPPDACGLERQPADMIYEGQAEVTTLVVHVLRQPGPNMTCEDCVHDELCQPVQASCRCGPALTSVEDVILELDEVVFEELDLDDTYCVRVAQLDIDINQDVPAWSEQCDPEFSCPRFLYDMPMIARRRLRACSLSEVVRFPGSTEISDHRCRADDVMGAFDCAEIDD
jgi:hypothetical protein